VNRKGASCVAAEYTRQKVAKKIRGQCDFKQAPDTKVKCGLAVEQ
jgi:hypothetical protein